MAGVTIELNEQEVRRRLGELQGRVADITPALRDMGEALLNSTRQRFSEMRGPEGHPWAPLSDEYRARKPKNADKILVLHGYLRGTLNYQIEDAGTTLAIGSPLIYAGTQQFGAKKGQYGSTSKGRPIPWGTIPARPFLGLSQDDKAEVMGILKKHLSRAF